MPKKDDGQGKFSIEADGEKFVIKHDLNGAVMGRHAKKADAEKQLAGLKAFVAADNKA